MNNIYKKFKECIHNNDGWCKLKDHNIGANGYSIISHCGKCKE